MRRIEAARDAVFLKLPCPLECKCLLDRLQLSIDGIAEVVLWTFVTAFRVRIASKTGTHWG